MIEIRVTENEDSAHRSTEEPTTTVWLVKNDSDQDMVVVSFGDDGDVNGIYMYEPGADPVELDSVDTVGTATEYEWADVTTWPVGKSDFDDGMTWRGDVLVTSASCDAAVDEEREQREAAESALDTAQADLMALVSAVAKTHALGHSGAQQWCPATICEAVRGLSTDVTP